MANKVKLRFEVPKSLSDIYLYKYQKYISVVQGIEQETEESIRFVNLKALEIFCGVNLKDAYNLPLMEFESIVGDSLLNCLSEETPLIKTFWFRNSDGVEVEFGMIPNLSEISFGEYVDIENYMSDWKNMHKAMAVLYRPVISKKKDYYLIEEYESSDKYSEFMKYMPTSVALGCLLFFYRLGMKLSRHSTAYSIAEMEKDQQFRVESQFLLLNGVTINQFMLSLEETYLNLTRLPKSQLKSVSLGSHLKKKKTN